ncbi:MAG TPA: carboxypeptidase regulatory-like domain-containing protein [Vicinamibacterales bacterium]|nr:carboxypeptidase regulatory-like domain-containing protein [Vicinamibacterales bacterium]
MQGVMRALVIVTSVLLVPAAVYAQQAQATIAGVVKDASGAVLPGVSVEASSPVLTEKVRSVVTDGTGQYRIVALPPGTYTVTVTLQGFNTVKREGIELSGALTATVDVDLRVGSLQETVTVTGESPIVDTQSARRQQVIDGEVLQAIPTSRSYNNVLQLVPGVVAGDGQVQLRPAMLLFTAHGGNTEDGRLTVDGINTGASRGGAGVSGYIPDMQNTAEITFTISGNLGEAETGGPSMAVVPKSGSNNLSGSFFLSGLNDSMQGNNFDDTQRNVFGPSPAKSLLLRDYQVSVGGPVKKDRIWFFFNHRGVDAADAQAGIYANKNAGDPLAWTYVPDTSRQGRIDQKRRIYALRLTMQLTPKNKLSLFWDEQPQCSGAAWSGNDGCMSNKDGWIYGGSQVNGFFGAGPNSPETGDYADTHQKVQQVKYTAPMTNRLLLEAGFGTYISQWGYQERPGNLTKNLVRAQEAQAQIFDHNGNRIASAAGCGDCLTVNGNLKYRSSNWPTGYIFAHTWNAAASYVTGAHNIKFGYQGAFHRDDDNLFPTISNTSLMQFQFNTPCAANPCPTTPIATGITLQSGVFTRKVRTEYYAFYGQEQWTRDRLTVQAALRFDHAWSHFPQQTIGPSVTIPTAIVLPAQIGIEGYNDLSPRVGVAYDLFGNGRTSVKGNIGRYLHPASNQGRYINANPSELVSTLTTRSWTDNNGNFAVDCDVLNGQPQSPTTTGSIDTCGVFSDLNFGRERPGTRLDDSILGGWGARPYDWQFGVSVQQELLPRVSVEAGYYRRWWPIFTTADVTDNINTTAADYTQFSVYAPTDAKLPSGGGYAVPGIYNITTAASLIAPSNVQKAANAYGSFSRYWDGFDITAQARLHNGLTLQGGTSTGRAVQDACETRAVVPEGLTGGLTNPYCRTVEPFLTTFKGIASYVIPRVDVNVAGTFSSRPGVSLSANVVYTSADMLNPARSTLGRGLNAAPTITVNVLEPNTVFGDRIDQLDLRIGKILRFGKTRTNLNVDIVNALNSNDNLAYSPTFVQTWPVPTSVIAARLFRLSAQFDF